MSGVSALILTKDESTNIARCIASLCWCAEVVVFDSLSTDGTPEVARSLGARVFERRFDNYGAQREAALRQVDWAGEWVLMVDADETSTPELAAEIPRALASCPSDIAAFRLRRKDYFKGKWIRRSTLYPSWHVRLLRHARVSFPPRAVHEYADVQGELGVLHEHLIHDNFSKGIAHWWERHLKYAQMEAAEAFANIESRSLDLRGILSLDPVHRRRSLKDFSCRLPCRPTLRYLYMMLLRGAILDGPAGWTYCRMIANYQSMTDQMLDELRRRARGMQH